MGRPKGLLRRFFGCFWERSSRAAKRPASKRFEAQKRKNIELLENKNKDIGQS